MNIIDSNWLLRTGQNSKVIFAAVLIICRVFVLVFMNATFWFWVVAVVNVVVGLLIFVFAIRCPQCNANVGWIITNTRKPVGNLALVQECPVCGDKGGEHIE